MTKKLAYAALIAAAGVVAFFVAVVIDINRGGL